MKELVILSGKGGTGKTSITASFAGLARNAILCDADVDASDLHLVTAPEIRETHDFKGGNEARINPDICSGCGLCQSLCRFEAIQSPDTKDGPYAIDGLACEGCGVCVELCTVQAIDFPQKTCGQWFASETRFGPMVHARLGIAEENSGRLVALVREEAKKRAREQHRDLILTDGPPGIGCPVIASIGQANAILIVAEPTVSGIHDMERVAKLAAHFNLPAMVCINKFDLNADQSRTIEKLAQKHGLGFMGKIPFDPEFTQAMIQGKSVMETAPNSEAAMAVKHIWKGVMESEAMSLDRIM